MLHRKKLALGLALALGGGLVSGHQKSLAAQEFTPRPSVDHPASAILLAGRATGLAQTDFDGDGVKDLAVAYRLGDRSAIAVFRGEYAALYPHFPAGVARRQALGGRVLPFDPEPLWVAESATADFLGNLESELPMRLDDNAMTDLVRIGEDGKLIFEYYTPVTTFTVNTTDATEDGVCDAHCSLNDAIRAANASDGSDAIAFNLPGAPPYRINSNGYHPVITETLTIDGSTQPGFAGEPVVELHGPSTGDGLIFGAGAISSLVRSLVINGFVSVPHLSYGIAISIGSTDTWVEGCRIGTSVDGLTAIPNTGGISYSPGANRGLVGGTAAGAGNLISGNLWFGVNVSSADTAIQGNRFGTNPSGTAAVANSTGVLLHGVGNRLGGDGPGTGNLISGNDSGVYADGQACAIQGNYIGTDITGEIALGNTTRGIWVAGSRELLIGGTTSPLASNVISGNLGDGIFGEGTKTRIEANKIGVSASGDSLPNGGSGVALTGIGNVVGGGGGIPAPAGNAIANNASGIYCNFGNGAFGMRILGNSIINNTAHNIFCGPPPPTLSFAGLVATGSGLVVTGAYQGEPNTTYRLEFFRSDSCGQGNHPGGFELIGARDVTTGAGGLAGIGFSLPSPPATLSLGNVITATANPYPLMPGVGDSLNATGFSNCQPVESVDQPYLSIPTHIPATVDSPLTIPIYFDPQTQQIAAMAFSLDLDSCLGFDPADADNDGIPDAVTLHLPAGWASSVSYNAGDQDGEIDFALFDLPTLVAAPDGLIAEVRLSVLCSSPPQTVPMPFSIAPAPSFGNVAGQSVPGTFSNGSVDIHSGQRGDCNGDGEVDAGDLTACGLEIFDGDGNFWLDVPGGSFPGNPVGCDSNADTVVDAGDLACTIRLIFGQSCAARAAEGFLPVSLTIGELEARAGSTLVPIYLETRGQSLTTTAFSLDLAADSGFDPSDHDGDGIPDAVRVLIPGNLVKVSYDAADEGGELDIILGDLSAQPRNLPRGNLLEIRFPVTGHARLLDFASDPPPSFGTATGASAPAVLSTLFSDGFESGNLAGWSLVVVP